MTCCIYGRVDWCIEGCGGVIQGCVDHLEELGIDGWLELKCVPKNKMACYGSGQGQGEGSCDHSYENSSSILCGDFLGS